MHALEESWRVLSPNGVLVDIRPYLGNMRLEVLSDDGVELAGIIDDSDLVPDHEAVDRSLAGGQKNGMFVKEEEKFFDYEYIWDTREDFKSYVDENWTSRKVSIANYSKLKKLVKNVSGNTRIRLRDVRIITRYRKSSTGVGAQ